MKRILSFAAAVGCLALCAMLFFRWTETAQQIPLAAFISTKEGDLPNDFSAVAQQLEQDGYAVAHAAACTDLKAATDQMTEQGAQVIIYRIDGSLPDVDFTVTARKNNVSLIFAGQAPVRALNTQYDKIWYLGSSVNDAGEQLGEQIALAFKNGTIADANQDFTLDYLTAADTSETAAQIISALTWECGLYGVACADRSISLARTRYAAPTIQELCEQWAALSKPEVIFCIGSEHALLAQQAALQLGWLEGEQPARLAAVAESEADAQALLQSAAYCGMVYYDKEAETEALYAMAVNLLEYRDIAYGLEWRRDVETPRFDLPYRRVELD